MEVDISNMLERHLREQSLLLSIVEDTIYSNPIHLKGVEPYRDKRRLLDLVHRVRKSKLLLNNNEFQFLESILQKYSK